MFFVLSKVSGRQAQPKHLRLDWRRDSPRWQVWRQRSVNMALIAIILIRYFNRAAVMITWLERQYPAANTSPTIDGLILLGGPFEASRSMKTNQLVVNDQIDRGLCFARLAKEYPNAKLVFTGGAGDITNPQANETPYAKNFFDIVGLSDRKFCMNPDPATPMKTQFCPRLWWHRLTVRLGWSFVRLSATLRCRVHGDVSQCGVERPTLSM